MKAIYKASDIKLNLLTQYYSCCAKTSLACPVQFHTYIAGITPVWYLSHSLLPGLATYPGCGPS